MPLPATYVKFTLVLGSQQKTNFYNVFYYVPSLAPTFTGSPMADALTFGNAAYTALTADLAAVLTTDSSVIGFNVDLLTGGQSYDVSVVNLIPGTVAGDELADFEAVVIQKRTATGGKSGRGRWYLGPVPETFTDENYITSAAALLYGNVLTDWINNVNALGTAWASSLFSKKNTDLYPITSGFVDPKVGQLGGRKSHSIL